MKYLKCFNESFYTTVPNEDYWSNKRERVSEPFTEYERKLVYDVFDKNHWKFWPNYFLRTLESSISIEMKSLDDKIILCSINIEKEDDEWFWCRVIRVVNSIPAATYKADQIDGLINLLESISLDLEKVYNTYLIEKFNESSNQYYNNQKFSIVRDTVVLYDENGYLVNKYNLEQFTKSEVDEIDNIMLSRFRVGKYNNEWTPMSLNYNYLYNFRYFICKSEDEWYFLSVTNIQSHEWFYYRCDQYEGLIKLLNDL